jgi:hypothetical protein
MSLETRIQILEWARKEVYFWNEEDERNYEVLESWLAELKEEQSFQPEVPLKEEADCG